MRWDSDATSGRNSHIRNRQVLQCVCLCFVSPMVCFLMRSLVSCQFGLNCPHNPLVWRFLVVLFWDLSHFIFHSYLWFTCMLFPAVPAFSCMITDFICVLLPTCALTSSNDFDDNVLIKHLIKNLLRLYTWHPYFLSQVPVATVI